MWPAAVSRDAVLPWKRWACLAARALSLVVLLISVYVPAAAAAAPASEPADLVYMNRYVYTMRVHVAGSTPTERQLRALQRIRELSPNQLELPVERVDINWQGQRAVSLRAGASALLTVFEQDIDPEVGGGLDDLAIATQHRMQLALDVRRSMSRPEVLARGTFSSAAAVLVCLGLSVFTLRMRRRITRPLEARITHEATQHRIFGIDWSDYALGVVRLLLQIGAGALILFWCVFALGHALRQFPATQPLAVEMRTHLIRVVFYMGDAIWRALPSVASIAVIVLAARATVWALGRLFDGIALGSIRITGLHADTARATHRLSVFVVWGAALAAVYPHIPGSENYVFRGVSVFLGFLVTMGSSSVVSQWMNGLVIVYSRALRVGDDVSIGTTEGRVAELGALSVKVVDPRGNEVTLPNTTVTSGTVVNFTRLASRGASHATVGLSLGYEVPYQRVRSLLQDALRGVTGLKRGETPRVLQKTLGDHAVVYEVQLMLDRSASRSQVLSDALTSIREHFDSAGVAILSPLQVMQVAAASSPKEKPPDGGAQ